MALIDILAQAIAQMEGFNVAGSVAQRNNNPGNLRASPYAVGTDSNGYAIFPDANTGQIALQYQLQLYANRGLDLEQMINTYAPASDNNNPTSYLNFVTSKLGVGPSTSVSALYDSTVNSTVLNDVSQGDTTDSSQSGFVLSDFLSGGVFSGDGTNGTGIGLGLGLLGLGIVIWLVKR